MGEILIAAAALMVPLWFIVGRLDKIIIELKSRRND